MKTKILIILILVASVAMLATGAFAYFTTGTKTATGNIKSGTLTMKIDKVIPTDACVVGTQDSISLWQDQNLAPGDVLTGKICMTNTGSLPIAQVLFNWSGTNTHLAEHMFVTKIFNSVTLVDEIAAYIAYYDANADGKMSLAEYMLRPAPQDYWVGGAPIFIPVAGTSWVEYALLFDPDADDTLQGATFSFNLNLIGYQKPQY